MEPQLHSAEDAESRISAYKIDQGPVRKKVPGTIKRASDAGSEALTVRQIKAAENIILTQEVIRSIINANKCSI